MKSSSSLPSLGEQFDGIAYDVETDALRSGKAFLCSDPYRAQVKAHARQIAARRMGFHSLLAALAGGCGRWQVLGDQP